MAANGHVGAIPAVTKVLQLVGNASKDLNKCSTLDSVAILEKLTAEGLKLECKQDLKVKPITPLHLQLAMRGRDEEVDTLIKGTTAGGGGVIPHIHKSVINKSSKD